MRYTETDRPALDAEVSPADLIADYTPNDLPRGRVIDHTKADMTPPDEGTVLVVWSPTRFAWEYSKDLQDTADYLRK